MKVERELRPSTTHIAGNGHSTPEFYRHNPTQYLMYQSKAYPRLSENELVVLCEKRDWASVLRSSPSPQEQAKGEQEYRDAIDTITLHNLGLIFDVAGHKARTKEDINDLVQQGYFGLRRAAERFRPELGNTFSTYAIPAIKNEIKKYYRNEGGDIIRNSFWLQSRRIKIRRLYDELEQRNGGIKPTIEDLFQNSGYSRQEVENVYLYYRQTFSVDSYIFSRAGYNLLETLGYLKNDSYDMPEDAVDKIINELILSTMQSVLDEREFFIISQRFDLFGDGERTLDEVGKTFGLSGERIRQIQSIAEAKLRGGIPALIELLDLEEHKSI